MYFIFVVVVSIPNLVELLICVNHFLNLSFHWCNEEATMVTVEMVWKEFKLLFWSEDSSALSLFLM